MTDLQTLKDSINLRDVVRQYWGEPEQAHSNSKYDKYFSRWRADGKKPAFTVYETGYKDYGGGGESGDVFSFIMNEEGCDFAEAVKIVERMTGKTVSRTSAPRQRPQPKEKPLEAPNDKWQKDMRKMIVEAHGRLMRNKEVLHYLIHRRGLTMETIQRFQLGWNPTWVDTRHRDGQGKNGKVYAFPGIVIPWQADGVLWAVRVRTVTGSFAKHIGRPDEMLGGKPMDKYLSVRGSKNSEGLFNGDDLKTGQPVMVVEGEFDAMLASQYVGMGVVTRGSSSTHNHIPKHWLDKLQMCSTVYSLMDTDDAGQYAVGKLSEQLGDTHHPLLLPDGKDITDYVVLYGGDASKILQIATKRATYAPTIKHKKNRPEPLLTRPAPPEPDFPPIDYEGIGHEPLEAVNVPDDDTLRRWEYEAAKKSIKKAEKDYKAERRRILKMDLQGRIQEQSDKVELPTFTPNWSLKTRYISTVPLADFQQRGTHFIVRSPIGTGKTELIIRVIQQLEKEYNRKIRVLVLNHRQALSRNLTRRLKDLGFVSYKDIDGDTAGAYAQEDKLVMSYDSMHKLRSNVTPTYDVIFIDEIEQFHKHLGGATMEQYAEANYNLLHDLVDTAGFFFGLDAHASDKSMGWLRNIRPQAIAVENEYVVQRGLLTMYKEMSPLIARAFVAADEDRGTVVVPTNSVAIAREIHYLAMLRYGAENVRLVFQRNAHMKDTQLFINQINDMVGNYRMLIYSPSLGTGVDITTPVRGVFGVFTAKPIEPTDMHQMMGRCRASEERCAYVQDVAVRNETDANILYALQKAAAMKTARAADFDLHNLFAFSGRHDEILHLLTRFQADTAKSMNDPMLFFHALAEHDGFNVQFNNSGKVKMIVDALASAKDAIKLYDREQTHAAEPVDDTEFEYYLMKGEVTEEIQYGHDRWLIENTVGMELAKDGDTVTIAGHDIDINVYDDLHKAASRREVRRFTDVLDEHEQLKELDRGEVERGRVATRRSHHTRRAGFIKTMFQLLWRTSDVELIAIAGEVSAMDIAGRLTSFFNEQYDTLQELFGWRPNHHSHDTVAIFRLVLKRIGLLLSSRQVMELGHRFMVYWVDEQSLLKMLIYGKARLEHLRRQREAYQEAITTKRNEEDMPVSSNLQNGAPAMPESGQSEGVMNMVALL